MNTKTLKHHNYFFLIKAQNNCLSVLEHKNKNQNMDTPNNNFNC